MGTTKKPCLVHDCADNIIFTDDEYSWAGLPSTVEDARKQLDLLFGSKSWLHDKKKSMEHAMAILQSFPETASDGFLLRDPVDCYDRAYPQYLYLPPICHFFRAEDCSDILAVYRLCPDALVIRGVDGRTRSYWPLHVAFSRFPRQHKQLLEAVMKVAPWDDVRISPFFEYLHAVMEMHASNGVEVGDVSHVIDLLWAGYDIPTEDERSRYWPGLPFSLGSTLTRALSKEYRPILNCLISTIPDACWDRPIYMMRMFENGLDIHMVHGLAILLPKFRNLELEVMSNYFFTDAEQRFLPPLIDLIPSNTQACKNLKFEFSVPAFASDARNAELARAIENCMSHSQCLTELRITCIDTPLVFEAIVAGLENNQKLEHLELSGDYLDHSADDQQGSFDLQLLLRLLQHSPPTLIVRDMRIIHGQKDSNMAATSGSSRLRSLETTLLTFERESFDIFVGCLPKLPALEELKIFGPKIVSGAAAVLSPLIPLDRLRRLHLGDCSWIDCQSLLALLKKNPNVVVIGVISAWQLQDSELAELYYYSLLNEYGRSNFRQAADMNKEEFLALLSEALNADASFFSFRLGGDRARAKSSLLYGLLREQPAILTSFALEPKKSGTKRRWEVLDAGSPATWEKSNSPAVGRGQYRPCL